MIKHRLQDTWDDVRRIIAPKLHCVLFVESDHNRCHVFNTLYYMTGGRRTDCCYLQSPGADISIARNDYRWEVLTWEAKPPNYRYFKYYVNVMPGAQCRTKAQFVGIVSELLEALWREQISAVCESSMNRHLPHNGRRVFHE